MTLGTDESLQAEHQYFWKSFNALHYFFVWFFKYLKWAMQFYFICNSWRPIERAKLSFLISHVIEKNEK